MLSKLQEDVLKAVQVNLKEGTLEYKTPITTCFAHEPSTTEKYAVMDKHIKAGGIVRRDGSTFQW